MSMKRFKVKKDRQKLNKELIKGLKLIRSNNDMSREEYLYDLKRYKDYFKRGQITKEELFRRTK